MLKQKGKTKEVRRKAREFFSSFNTEIVVNQRRSSLSPGELLYSSFAPSASCGAMFGGGKWIRYAGDSQN